MNNFDLLRLLAALQVALVHGIAYLKPTGNSVHVLVRPGAVPGRPDLLRDQLGVGSLGRITTPDWLPWWGAQMSIFQKGSSSL